MSDRIPAWKKLGLRLKNDTGPDQSVEPQRTSKKRKLSSELPLSSTEISVAAANDRHVDVPVHGTLQSNGAAQPPSNSAQDRAHASADPAPPPKKKRKSVTFSTDAKEADGPLELDVSAENDGSPDSGPTGIEKSKKKKERKPRSPKAQPSTETSIDAPEDQSSQKSVRPYLQYLDQYSNNRFYWKFNKNQQTQLLQNIFNLYRIPAQHDGALIDYVSGLQGTAARTRLKEDAEETIAKQTSSSSQPPLEDATLPQIDASASSPADVEKQKLARAKAIVEALSVKPPNPNKPTQTMSTALDKVPSASQSRKPGRKRRRGKHDISSSESSEESSELSESSESS